MFFFSFWRETDHTLVAAVQQTQADMTDKLLPPHPCLHCNKHVANMLTLVHFVFLGCLWAHWSDLSSVWIIDWIQRWTTSHTPTCGWLQCSSCFHVPYFILILESQWPSLFYVNDLHQVYLYCRSHRIVTSLFLPVPDKNPRGFHEFTIPPCWSVMRTWTPLTSSSSSSSAVPGLPLHQRPLQSVYL